MKLMITIIVPVYNTEAYLDRCIQSVINQTYHNIEIIIVDDGSTDNSPEMCDLFARQDSRIRVIHKENNGPSDARNAALAVANGDYILFVDSDDYIEINACERLINALNGCYADIVIGNARRVTNGDIVLVRPRRDFQSYITSGEEILEYTLKKEPFPMAIWLNMYNREFLIVNSLKFKKGMLHEDEHFTPRVLLKAKKVLNTDIIFYNYMIRHGSITTSEDLTKNVSDMIKICFELEKIYSELSNIKLKKMLLNSLVDNYLNIFQSARLYNRRDKSYVIDKGFLLRNASTLRTTIKALLFCISRPLYYVINRFFKHILS